MEPVDPKPLRGTHGGGILGTAKCTRMPFARPSGTGQSTLDPILFILSNSSQLQYPPKTFLTGSTGFTGLFDRFPDETGRLPAAARHSRR